MIIGARFRVATVATPLFNLVLSFERRRVAAPDSPAVESIITSRYQSLGSL